MRFTSFSATTVSAFALGASLLASSAPISKRAANPTDLLVLKFAHVLEQFETQFYTQALQKFQTSDFTSAGFSDPQVPIQQFTAIQVDESAHVSILAQTIQDQGDTPITSCSFNFDAALADVPTMAATARVVENLGVAAYLGAAHLVSDPVLLTAAASIMTVEARHQTVLNMLNKGSAIPSPFDLPFNPSEVLAVASQFISGCDVGVPANPTLSITNTGPVQPGTSLTFSSAAINGSTDGFSCQMMVGGAPFAIVLPFSQCVVPSGINGPVAIFITSDAQPLNNNIRDQASDKLIAGPTMAFIDSVQEDISQVVLSGSASSSSSSSSSPSGSSSSSSSSDSSTPTGTTLSSASTQTITPAEASAVISSAGASPTGSTNAAVASPGGPNFATGTSGSLSVSGWSSVSS